MSHVLVKVSDGHTLDQLVVEIRARGGAPIHLFPPGYVIARLGDGPPLTCGARVDPATVATDDPAARTAAATVMRLEERARNAGAPAPAVSWDVPGKKPPVFERTTPLPLVPPAFGPAASTGTPTSRFLIGRVAVAVVIVSRARGTAPNPPAEFLSPGERDLAAVEAAEGLGWLATLELAAGVEMVIERHDVELTVVPSATTPDQYEAREAVWRDPALATLGLPAGRDGYARLARDVRDRNNARWGYVLFVTRYPLHHFAYASVERVVQHYDNDGWGTSELNRVIAHESCHIFGALDEYASSGCSCTEQGGELRVVNGNCRGCAASFVPCIMEANTLAMCDFTRGQLGWRAPLLGAVGDGSLWREANGAIWVIVGGARFHVPDPATLQRLFAGVTITQVATGALDAIPTTPVDDTMLREDNGAIWIIAGGARFHVPDPTTLQRIYPGHAMFQLWDGALDGIATVPADGALLREENGAIWAVHGRARIHVPDPATLARVYPRQPIRQLWDGALNGLLDAADERVFEVAFYLDAYPDLQAAFGTDRYLATQHWASRGLPVEGRRGSRALDVGFYLDLYPDLRAAFGTDHVAAARHWATQGLPAEGRRGSRELDVRFYVDVYPDLKAAFGADHAAAMRHWITQGLPVEGRRGSREVDVAFYVDAYPDLKTAFGTDRVAAMRHWITRGLPHEGRRAAREFDVAFYLGAYADLKAAFGTDYVAAARHWITQGLPNEGRRGSAELDVRFYLHRYPDLTAAFSTDFAAAMMHWITRGFPVEHRQGVA